MEAVNFPLLINNFRGGASYEVSGKVNLESWPTLDETIHFEYYDYQPVPVSEVSTDLQS